MTEDADWNIRKYIDFLRADEGDSVTLFCDNPDFNGQPNCAIECNGYWTNWQDKRFTGDTIEAALELAYFECRQWRENPPADVSSDPLGLAEGCRSASSPCAHQKASPYTLCEICQPALKVVTIVIPSGYRDAAEFLKDCQFEEAHQPLDPVSTPSGSGK